MQSASDVDWWHLTPSPGKLRFPDNLADIDGRVIK
jgi:hypothetical protein